MILISSRPVGMELARELFAIVQITSVRRVINDVISTDDLKIWIRTTNRLTPEPRLSLLTREARERSSSETERTSWFKNLLVRRDPEATKRRKILELNSN